MFKRKMISGFTLVELMVTMSIIAILAFIAVPEYVNFQRNSEISSRASIFIGAINSGRSEAMKRGMRAMVTPLDEKSWNTGLRVFVDINSNGKFDEATEPVIYSNSEAFPSYLEVVSPTGTAKEDAPYILFDAQGYSKTKDGAFSNATISFARNDVPSSSVYSQTRRIIILQTGRARVCTPLSESDKTCKAGGDS